MFKRLYSIFNETSEEPKEDPRLLKFISQKNITNYFNGNIFIINWSSYMRKNYENFSFGSLTIDLTIDLTNPIIPSNTFIILIIKDHINDDSGHANLLINFNDKLYRFEPHGTYTHYDHKILDNLLTNSNKSLYISPLSYQQYYGPQALEESDYIIKDTGFCLIWCCRFIHLILANPQSSIEDIYKYLCRKKDSEISHKGQIAAYATFYTDGFIREHDMSSRSYIKRSEIDEKFVKKF